MKALIYTFLALFIWTLVPVDATASRDNRQEHRSTDSRKSSDYGRHDKRDHGKKNHNKHHRQVVQRRPQHWQPTRVKYVPVPVYRSYIVPTGYVYASTPGVVLYFNW